MKNYQEEPIPDFQEITNEILDSMKELSKYKKYRFDELFSAHPKGGYNTNRKLLKEEIGFNAWLNDADKDKGKAQNEIQGLYIFYEDDVPVYVGISRKLIRRLRNHFLGKSHFEASLVYLMARHDYDNNIAFYKGTRANFPFDNYRPKLQQKMQEHWTISIIPELNHHKLYYLEFAIACELKTKWNAFMTH